MVSGAAAWIDEFRPCGVVSGVTYVCRVVSEQEAGEAARVDGLLAKLNSIGVYTGEDLQALLCATEDGAFD